MESDNGHKTTFDYFTVSDDIEMTQADGQWIAVVHTDDLPSLTLTVDISSYGRTAYLIYDTLIVKVCQHPEADGRLFCVIDVGMFSYLSLVSMMLVTGLSSESMITIPGERAMVVTSADYFSSGSTFFVSAQDLPWMNDGHTTIHQLRTYVRAKFDLLSINAMDFVCLCSNHSSICWAGNAKAPATEFTLSLIRWAPSPPLVLAEILDDMVNDRILLKDLVSVHTSFRTFQPDYFTENPVASFANDVLWPTAKPVLRARYSQFRNLAYGDYIQLVADEIKQRAMNAEDDVRLASEINRILGDRTGPGYASDDGPHSETGPQPGITRETLREAIRLSEPNRGGDGFETTRALGRLSRRMREDRGYQPSQQVVDEIYNPVFGQNGGPMNPQRNNDTDPISFGDGRESASYEEVGETPDGPGLDSPRQTGIDPNCERSMMIAPTQQ